MYCVMNLIKQLICYEYLSTIVVRLLLNLLCLYMFCGLQGLDVGDGQLGLVSDVIRKTLDIECAVLMGANVAPEVSIECFCEATVGKYLFK